MRAILLPTSYEIVQGDASLIHKTNDSLYPYRINHIEEPHLLSEMNNDCQMLAVVLDKTLGLEGHVVIKIDKSLQMRQKTNENGTFYYFSF